MHPILHRWAARAGDFLSSPTGSCTAASVVSLTCCAVILAIRADRQASLSVRDDLPSSVVGSFDVLAHPTSAPITPITASIETENQAERSVANPYAFSSFEPSDATRVPDDVGPLMGESELDAEACAELGAPIEETADTPDDLPAEESESCPDLEVAPLENLGEAESCEETNSESNSPEASILVLDEPVLADDDSSLPEEEVEDFAGGEETTTIDESSEMSTDSAEVADKVGESTLSEEKPSSAAIARVPRLSADEQQTVISKLAPVAQRAEQTIRRAFSLADKGATYSARGELETALQTVAHGLDVYHDTNAHATCLAEALVALREATDFLPSPASARSRLSVATIAAKHRSPVLMKDECRDMESPEAMRRYCNYARERFVAASGGIPVASEALFGLGRLAMIQAGTNSSTERAHHLTAMLLLQAALEANPRNGSAANEFGVLLARDGRLEDARQVLEHGISVEPLAESWRNLMVVNQRLGSIQKSEQARMEWQQAVERARQTQPGLVTAANGPSVQWVDKSTFERGGVNLDSAATTPAQGILR